MTYRDTRRLAGTQASLQIFIEFGEIPVVQEAFLRETVYENVVHANVAVQDSCLLPSLSVR